MNLSAFFTKQFTVIGNYANTEETQIVINLLGEV